jgi:hypothetical protein
LLLHKALGQNPSAAIDSMPGRVMAGGGMRHGQVIGSTDSKGYEITSRRVGPSDPAATVFHHLGIDPNADWIDPQGRPQPIVTEGGMLIEELV